MSSSHFNWIIMFVFWVLSCKSPLYMLDTKPSSDMSFANIVPNSVGCLIVFLLLLLLLLLFCVEAFYFDKVSIVYFCFCFPCLQRYNQRGAWVAQSLSIWLRLRLWSHSLWVLALHQALCHQHRAHFGPSVPLFLWPSPACTLSVSLPK